MPGRIEIDDVAPVVSGGRYPANAVVGEVVPVCATVWREGHEAVSATLVVRYLGTAYPQVRPAARGGAAGSPRNCRAMSPGRTPDVFHGQFAPDGSVCGPSGSTAGVIRSTTWRHAVTAKLDAGQGEEDLDNDLIVGADLLERAATGVPRADRGPLLEAATALRRPGDPLTRAALALSHQVTDLLDRYPLRELITRGHTYGVWVDRPAGPLRRLVRAVPAVHRRARRAGPAGARHLRHRRRRTAPRRRRWASTSSICRRSTRSDRCTARAATTASPPNPATSAHRGRSAAPRAATTPCTPTSAPSTTSTTFVAAARDLGLEVALDLALQCAPDHPWAREHRQWFTELPDGTIAYAENPPKKYQDIYPLNFDNDPQGLYARGAAGGAALDQPRRQDLPGRQPAHQAAGLLGLADRRGQGHRSRRAVPRRGVHPAGPAVRVGQTRLHPVLFVLHLAHREVGA